jgi:hypothetical protein
MKTLTSLILASALAAGCSTPPAALLTPQTVQTNQIQTIQTIQRTNAVIVTNIVQEVDVVTVTNGLTLTNQVLETNLVNEVVPVLVTNLSYRTNLVTVTNGYAVSSLASNVVGVASIVNAATSPINPFSGLVGTFLALSTAGLGYYARLKTKQAQQHLSTATTMITAIEGLAPAAAAGVKTAIADQALKMGTADTVNSTVQAVTQSLPSST